MAFLKEEGSTGWQNPDDELYVPLLTGAQRLFGTDRVDSINVGISNDDNVDAVMMTIEEILRAKHDIGPGEDNDFRISDYSQFADLRRQANWNLYCINCRYCWNKPYRWRYWCDEYYACVCNRENKRNRLTKGAWSNSKSNNDAIYC